jgi:hypothetical protein
MTPGYRNVIKYLGILIIYRIFIMKRKIIFDAILYENSMLKAKYNELLSLTSKLESENNTLKNQINKPDYSISNTIFTLKEINQELSNEIVHKNNEIHLLPPRHYSKFRNIVLLLIIFRS